MKEKTMKTLSDKIPEERISQRDGMEDILFVKDVKQFIKDLNLCKQLIMFNLRGRLQSCEKQ